MLVFGVLSTVEALSTLCILSTSDKAACQMSVSLKTLKSSHRTYKGIQDAAPVRRRSSASAVNCSFSGRLRSKERTFPGEDAMFV